MTLVFDEQKETPSGLVFDEPGLVFDDAPLSTIDTIAAGGQKLLDGVAMGFGDEIAAGGRAAIDSLLTGSDFGSSYEMYIKETRDIEDQFTKENPVLSAGLEIGSAIVPAVKLAGLAGNAATRLGNVARQSGVAAAETVAREIGENEGKLGDRLANIDPLMVGLGAGLGAVGGGFMRGQRSIDEIAAAEAAGRDSAGNVTEKGIAGQSKARNFVEDLINDTYSAVKREVGDVPARQMVRADGLTMRWKQDLHHPSRLPVKALDNLTKSLSKDGKVNKLLADAGAVTKDADGNLVPVFSPKGRKNRVEMAISTLAKTDKAAANTLREMTKVIDVVQRDMRRVFPNMADQFEEGYFPLYAKQSGDYVGFKRPSTAAKTDSSTQARKTGFISETQALEAFENPVNNFMSFFEDSIDALALARAYGVKSSTKKLKNVRSYTDNIIRSIVKSKKSELGEEGAQRLGEYLKLYAIDGRGSMGQIANVLRTASHAALLATPENAMLQAGDLGQAAYATSFSDAIKALPKSLKSMLITDGDVVYTGRGMQDTLRMADLGLSRQHLNELVNQNKHWIPKHITKVGDVLMQGAGVRKANRLGVETNLNAQISQMRRLADKGRDAVADSVYAEGLTPKQIDRLYSGIKSGNVRDPAVMDSAFFRIGRFQPVSRTSMPPAYLASKDGRLLWSMKMYMVKMGSKFWEDVIGKAYAAEKAGLNTEKGRGLMREAIINTGRYSSFILALNAVVDPKRKEVFRGKESENSYPEEFARQGVSFATGGVVDLNSPSYGKTVAEGMIPPAVQALMSPIELGLSYLNNGDVTPGEMRRAAMFVPGARQILYAHEVAERGEE